MFFEVFYLAHELGKTIPELLLGQSQPMSNQEFNYWRAFMAEKMRLEKEANDQASKKSKKQGQADQEFKRTMGQPPR